MRRVWGSHRGPLLALSLTWSNSNRGYLLSAERKQWHASRAHLDRSCHLSLNQLSSAKEVLGEGTKGAVQQRRAKRTATRPCSDRHVVDIVREIAEKAILCAS